MVIKQIFDLIFTRQISVRLKLVRQVRLQRRSANSRLQLRGMKTIMNTPPLRELQAERDSTNLLDDRKRPSPFGSQFMSQTRSSFQMLSRQPGFRANRNIDSTSTFVSLDCHTLSSTAHCVMYQPKCHLHASHTRSNSLNRCISHITNSMFNRKYRFTTI